VLTDGIFAVAMTILVLDLRLPRRWRRCRRRRLRAEPQARVSVAILLSLANRRAKRR
jgi:uncharacterized membrane protein